MLSSLDLLTGHLWFSHGFFHWPFSAIQTSRKPRFWTPPTSVSNSSASPTSASSSGCRAPTSGLLHGTSLLFPGSPTLALNASFAAVRSDTDVQETKVPDAPDVRTELERLANVRVLVRLPPSAAAPLVPGVDGFSELAVKLVLNAVSTGAHVLVGKVYRSLMIDLRVSNHKLLHRAVAIVERLVGVPRPAAIDCVLRAIYRLDHGDELEGADVRESQHRGESQNGVVEKKELRNLTEALALLKTWSSSVHVLQVILFMVNSKLFGFRYKLNPIFFKCSVP